MSVGVQLFFEVIQVSIGQRQRLSISPGEQEWFCLFELAKKQSLVGICFAGIKRLNSISSNLSSLSSPTAMLSKALYLQWMGLAAKIQQRNETLNSQCVALQAMLCSDGVRSSIFKGQSIGALYGPQLSLFRQSGDIDLYIDCGREKTIKYLASHGQNNPEWDYVHAHAKYFGNTEVEFHYRLGAVRNVWKNIGLQKFWKEYEEELFRGKAEVKNGEIVCPSSRMHLFYLIHHAYRHLISGGIGLRQMMDLYFALMKRDNADDEWLKANVDRFGMKRFCEASMWVMNQVFGMGQEVMPWEPNQREGEFLLEEIMIGGNFGKSDTRYGTSNTKGGSLLHIIRRNLHLVQHYGNEALAAPLYYVWHFFWKRMQKA